MKRYCTENSQYSSNTSGNIGLEWTNSSQVDPGTEVLDVEKSGCMEVSNPWNRAIDVGYHFSHG